MKQLHPLNEVRLPADCTRHANGRWCIAKEDGFSTCMVGAWWSARILACRWGLACMHAKAADTCLLHGITGCLQKKYLVPSHRHPVVSSALSSSLSPCPLPSPAPLLRLSQCRPSPSPAPALRPLQRLLRPLLRWGDGDLTPFLAVEVEDEDEEASSIHIHPASPQLSPTALCLLLLLLLPVGVGVQRLDPTPCAAHQREHA